MPYHPSLAHARKCKRAYAITTMAAAARCAASTDSNTEIVGACRGGLLRRRTLLTVWRLEQGYSRDVLNESRERGNLIEPFLLEQKSGYVCLTIHLLRMHASDTGLRHYHHGRGCAMCSVYRLEYRDSGSLSWGSSTTADFAYGMASRARLFARHVERG